MLNHPFNLLPFYLIDCKLLEIAGQDNNFFNKTPDLPYNRSMAATNPVIARKSRLCRDDAAISPRETDEIATPRNNRGSQWRITVSLAPLLPHLRQLLFCHLPLLSARQFYLYQSLLRSAICRRLLMLSFVSTAMSKREDV